MGRLVGGGGPGNAYNHVTELVCAVCIIEKSGLTGGNPQQPSHTTRNQPSCVVTAPKVTELLSHRVCGRLYVGCPTLQ